MLSGNTEATLKKLHLKPLSEYSINNLLDIMYTDIIYCCVMFAALYCLSYCFTSFVLQDWFIRYVFTLIVDAKKDGVTVACISLGTLWSKPLLL